MVSWLIIAAYSRIWVSFLYLKLFLIQLFVSAGSPSRELHAAPPRGHYGEYSLHDRCLKHVWNHANLLAHMAHDVIGGVPGSIKGHLLNTSSSLLSACSAFAS